MKNKSAAEIHKEIYDVDRQNVYTKIKFTNGVWCLFRKGRTNVDNEEHSSHPLCDLMDKVNKKQVCSKQQMIYGFTIIYALLSVIYEILTEKLGYRKL